MSEPSPPLRDWHELSADEQLALREDYGRFLDSQPASCDLEAKIARFQGWLAGRGVRYVHRG